MVKERIVKPICAEPFKAALNLFHLAQHNEQYFRS